MRATSSSGPESGDPLLPHNGESEAHPAEDTPTEKPLTRRGRRTRTEAERLRKADAPTRSERTVVVIIHGMGEQLPMETLRSFIENLLPSDRLKVPIRFYNKPDVTSGKTDLRRLVVPGRRERPMTDFVEYYWAPEFDEGRLLAFAGWLARNLVRIPIEGRKVGWKARTRGTRILLNWLRLIAALVLISAAVFFLLREQIEGWEWFGLLSAVAAIAWFGLSWILKRYLTDVSRYFSPSSRDISARNAIRAGGIQLLSRLHESGKYSRIIVVGHSLGSVIGYDILRLSWEQFRRRPEGSVGEIGLSGQTTLATFDDEAESILSTRGRDGQVRASQFQELQTRLAQENRRAGIPWLVTDFVTLGSPLAHAEALYRDKRYPFETRKAELEFPACPPIRTKEGEPKDTSFYVAGPRQNPETNYRAGTGGAVFGPTRWTNLYFPSSWLLSGDPAGGPLSGDDLFGMGIKDIPVRLSYSGWSAVWRHHVPFYSHTAYWKGDRAVIDRKRSIREADDARTGTKDAITAMRSAVRI